LMAAFIDLHVHSQFSGDSPVEPEKYLERLALLRKEFRLDGLAFCEHRKFAGGLDCAALGQKYDALVFIGVEAETLWGHLLVFCPDTAWMNSMDFSRKLDPVELAEAVAGRSGIVVPAHPFRGLFSIGDKVQRLPGIAAVESINGANTEEENERARSFARLHRLAELGGSDAHFLDELGRTLTAFQAEVKSLEQMIAEIKAGRVRPLYLRDARI